MNHHKTILTRLKRTKGKGTRQSKSDSYISSGHHYYDISVPERRKIAKEWLGKNQSIPNKEFIVFLDHLFKGKSHEEKTIASHLLGYHTEHRKVIAPRYLDDWLNSLVGWAEIDTLCFNVFTSSEISRDWKSWKTFLQKLSKNKNISKRRAALVFLVGPVHYSDDERFSKLAFEIINKLKHEKAIIITKAISWLLRSMVKHHKRAVRDYVEREKSALPKIAIRETYRKIKTGKK